jgi:tetratricopeptide (TPR) repeat protein
MRVRFHAGVVVLTVALAVPRLAGAQDAEAEARRHFEQAEMFMQARVYDKAIEEYSAAYRLAPTAHGLIYNIGLAYENWGKRSEALEKYRDYLDKDPGGEKAAEVRARIISLERTIADEEAEAARRAEEEKRRADDGPPDADETARRAVEDAARSAEETRGEPDAALSRDAPAREKKGISWTLVGLGAGALAGGLAADLIPGSARNGKLDASDFLPLALYGAGGVLVVIAIF